MKESKSYIFVPSSAGKAKESKGLQLFLGGVWSKPQVCGHVILKDALRNVRLKAESSLQKRIFCLLQFAGEKLVYDGELFWNSLECLPDILLVFRQRAT